MSKRFTDTEKWKDDWYLSLDNNTKIVWQYLLDSCNHAGVLKKSFRLLNYYCSTTINEISFNEVFKERVIDCGSYYFIPKFIKFQYGDLKSNRPVIVSVIKELENNNLIELIKESLPNDYLIIKSKAKAKRTAKSNNNIDIIDNGEIPFGWTPPQDEFIKLKEQLR